MTDTLESENARLRARVEELEHKLYPPPPPPEKPDDPTRYFFAPAADERYVPQDDPIWKNRDGPGRQALVDVQELFIGWAFDYARERHADNPWRRVYRWADIPAGGFYTTAREVEEAKRGERDVTFYEIDKRTAALATLGVYGTGYKQLRARRDELLHAYCRLDLPRRLEEQGLWIRRNDILDEAVDQLLELYKRACRPLTEYTSLTQDAAHLVDEALAASHV
jgi:hypothetical protein